MPASRNCRRRRPHDRPDRVRAPWPAFRDEERLFEGSGGAAIRFAVDAGLTAKARWIAPPANPQFQPAAPLAAVEVRVSAREAADEGFAFAST
jgi:hypothetical protein